MNLPDARYIFPEIDTSFVTRNKQQPGNNQQLTGNNQQPGRGLGRGVTKDNMAKRPTNRRRDFFSVESLREQVKEEISSEDIADTILAELRRKTSNGLAMPHQMLFFRR